MILSEQTSNTTSNTLHEVRHSLLSSSSAIGSWVAPPASSHCPSGLMQFSLLAPPCCGWVGPFLPRLGPTLGPSLSGKSLTCFDHLGSSFPLAYLSIDVTGALVPYSPKCMFWAKFLSVLVCLSVDVTGALVLLQFVLLFLSFLFCCTPLFPFCLRFVSCLTLVKRTLLFTCFVCTALILLGCLVLLCLCCPAGRGIVLSLCSCCFASSSFWFFALLCACAGPVVSFVVCSPLLWFLSLSCLPSLPREWSCLCSGPACTLVCWYLPPSIWLQL